MNKKRELHPIPKHAGIYRVVFWNEEKKKWEPPTYGKPFVATRREYASNGKRRKVQQSFAHLDEAKLFREHKVERVEKTSQSMLFKDLATNWSSNCLIHKDLSTQIRYKSYLKHFAYFDKLPVEDIRPPVIDAWIAEIKKPEYLARGHTTRCTYNHEWSVLRSILGFYTSRVNRSYQLPFVSDHKAMLKVKEPKMVKKDLSLEEVRNFFEALKKICAEKNCEGIYYMARMQYAIYSRIQEAAALHFEDFDLKNRKIRVNKKVQWMRAKGMEDRIVDGAKSNSGKELEMGRFAETTFKEWIVKSGIRSGLLFRDHDGKPFTYRQIENRYNQALKNAGLPFRATHLLRHAALSEHYDTAKDITATQQVAGQKDLRSTMRYVKIRSSQVKAAQLKMDEKLSVLS